MTILQKADASIDLDRYSLRRFLKEAEAIGELETHEGKVDLADLAAHFEGSEKAVYFKNAGPEGAEVVGNVTASRGRIARAFGVTPDKLLHEVLRRLDNKPQMVEVTRTEAPVQQVVLTGDDADLTKLPANLQHGLDGAPYISAGIDVVRDPATGMTNVGIRRLMLRNRKEAGVDLLSPSDLKAIYEAGARRGEKTPIAFVLGAHPVDHVAAVMRMPIDEVGIMASLRDGPMPVVKCVTNDIMVPADAEMILEGYLDERGHVEPEGPYGEFLGYYGELKMNPVFHLTAITRRADALFQTSTIGGRTMGCTDTAQLNATRAEVTIWRALQTAVREPVDVNVITASGGSLHVRVSIRQRVPGESRNAIAAIFGSVANAKHIWVVDPDVDIRSDGQMDWAMATRFQADRDLVVQGGFRVVPLDPSLRGSRVGAKAGFDCTLPFPQALTGGPQIPAPPTYPGKRFDTIAAALADGPKFFQELMAALGSRDGREIVLMLDDLRVAGKAGRDKEGRWIAL
ncbi:MAG: UbiD family decarboxylase [Hyphomicrobiales bacterium]|nr:UbiD family decarboxylase [Hyphomicrobiales bacterium]